MKSSTKLLACTLTTGDLDERVNGIRALASESLLRVRREPLAPHLTYAADTAERVCEMVRKEEACCFFLRFDLFEDAHGIHLSVIAPEEARAAARELFIHFAPELARPELLPSPSQKEPA